MEELNSYEEFCMAFERDKPLSLLLLYLQDWMISAEEIHCIYENKLGLDEFLGQITQMSGQAQQDMLEHIIFNAQQVCYELFESLGHKIIQENKMVPVSKVKKINSFGLNWISRLPGRTLKEKISATHSVMSVQHRHSLNTGENQLFLAFLKNLNSLLQIRKDYSATFSSEIEEFHQSLYYFLKRSELEEIAPWRNMQPNNTLLFDRNYRVIWNSWCSLQDLDETISRYQQNLDLYFLTIFYYKILCNLRNKIYFPQIPLTLDPFSYTISMKTPFFTAVDSQGNLLSIEQKQGKIQLNYQKNKYTIEIFQRFIEFKCNDTKIKKEMLNSKSIEKIILELENAMNLPSGKVAKIRENTVKSSAVVVDICSLLPHYFTEDGVIFQSEHRMMCQTFSSKSLELTEKYTISSTLSDGILLPCKDSLYNIRTETMLTAVTQSAEEELKFLAGLLKSKFNAEAITFLFPDYFHDFQLAMVQKALRLFYPMVQSLSKGLSIAFYHQFTDECRINVEKNPEFLLIMDHINDKLSLTLLKAECDKLVALDIPDFSGLIWERHPSYAVPLNSKVYLDLLEKYNCPYPEIVYQLFQKQGLEQLNSLRLFLGEEKSFAITEEFLEELNQLQFDVTQEVDTFLKQRESVLDGSEITIISLASNIKYSGLNPSISYTKTQVLAGFRQYQQLQSKTEYSLWKDNLPKLAIKYKLEKVELITNQKVTPQFGKVIEIEIGQSITLPKGKEKYRFPLVELDMDTDIEYLAVVEHSAFPLAEDVECKLKMLYEYGAENPYELFFIPKYPEESQFLEVKVRWSLLEEYEFEDLDYPPFLPMYTWEELKKFPASNGRKWTSNLLQYISYDFAALNLPEGTIRLSDLTEENNYQKQMEREGKTVIVQFKERRILQLKEKNAGKWISFQVENSLTYHINILERNHINWQRNHFGYFLFQEIFVENQWVEVGFYDSNFENKKEFHRTVNAISFELTQDMKGKYIAVNIRPQRGEDSYQRANFVEYSHKRNREQSFAMFKVFFNGRNLSQQDFPPSLQSHLIKTKDLLLQHYKDPSSPCDKVAVFRYMSLLSKDIGKEYYDIVLELLRQHLDNPKLRFDNAIGYSLGGYQTEEEIHLFEKLQQLNHKKLISILAKAVWNHKDFIFNCPSEKILYYFECCVDCCETFFRERKLVDLSIHLEFILAVFRLRESKNSDICYRLSLNNPKVKKIYNLTEQMLEKNIQIQTRIQLASKNKELPQGKSEFLWNLLLYISGNTSGSDIIISSDDT